MKAFVILILSLASTGAHADMFPGQEGLLASEVKPSGPDPKTGSKAPSGDDAAVAAAQVAKPRGFPEGRRDEKKAPKGQGDSSENENLRENTGGIKESDKIVKRESDEHERKIREQQREREQQLQREKERQWNQAQDQKSYDYRMSHTFGNHSGATGYVPATPAPKVDPYVAYEFKDAAGNIWEAINGSPEKLQELADSDPEGQYVTAPKGSMGAGFDLLEEDATETPATANRVLFSIATPGGATANASSSVGAQNTSINLFFNNVTAGQSPVDVRNVIMPSRDVASLESPKEEEKDKDGKKNEKIPNITINNNVSVEGSDSEDGYGGQPPSFATRALMLLRRKLGIAPVKSTAASEKTSLVEGTTSVGHSPFVSRPIASMAKASTRTGQAVWIWVALVVTLLAFAGREMQKRHWLLAVVKRKNDSMKTKRKSTKREERMPHRASEPTMATSATQINRR